MDEELLKKYNKVNEENKKAQKLLESILKLFPNIVFDGAHKNLLFFTRIKKIFYLENHKNSINFCLVCGKTKKTSAHHLIPLRAKCKNRILKELRIRVCDKCEKKIHPENKWIPIIIKDRDKKIERLEEKIKKLKENWK